MSRTGESRPLLRSQSTRESASVTFDDSSERPAAAAENAGSARLLTRSNSSISQVLQRFTRSERDRALQKEGVGPAAFLIRDAVLGDVENPASGAYDPYANPETAVLNLLSVVSRRICAYRPLLQLLTGIAWVLVALTFIEPPVWCQSLDAADPQSCQTLLNLSGVPAGAVEDSAEVFLYFPNSRSMLITTQQSMLIEWICLGLIGIFKVLRIARDGFSFGVYMRVGKARTLRIIQSLCMIAMVVGLLTGYRVYQPYLRGILLCTFLPTIQRDCRVLVAMMPEILNVLALLAVFITFYAWFGCVMFVDTPEGEEFFPSLVEAWWSLWIMVTTANYPDVMMPSYNANRWTAVYFVSFMIISFFFLMNVILASVVSEYDAAVESRQKEYKDMAHKNLKQAFGFLDSENTGRIDRDTVMALFLLLNEDFPEFRSLSEEDTKLLFAVLDKDGSSTITEDEFMDFGNVLLLEFVKTSDYASVIETHFPKIYSAQWYKPFAAMIKSENFELFIDALLVANAIVIAIQTYPELSGTQTVHIDPKYWDGSIDTVWELVETGFTVIYLLEVVVKIVVIGWKRYIESQKNIFDFTVTLLAMVCSIIVYYPNEFSDSRIIRMVVMARVLRLVRLLTAIKRFQLIGSISAEILPDAAPVVLILFLVMYFFSALGVQLYGGYITRDPSNPLSSLVLGTDFSNNEYWANNFNDMVGAMNVLFNLLVVNNWTECEVGYEATTEAKWVRLFFISFHVCGVILVNNLVIAFIINSFLTQLQIFRERDDAEFVGENEAVLFHRQAVFDGSEITGTKTDLKGAYIARLRHSASSEEGHYHERLKRLFTQGSSVEENP